MGRFIHFSRKLIPHIITYSSLQKITKTKEAQLFSSNVVTKPVFDLNIIRLLRNQFNSLSLHHSPLIQPDVQFKSFTVEDRPGEQWITMKGKYGEDETIKIEATMFDGSAMVSKSDDGIAGADMSLHISLLVDISKVEGHDLEFVCSAWSDHIEIQKVYIFNRDKSLYQPYMGPNFRDLHTKLQNALTDFLKERGVNGDLSIFVHDFMLNKEKVELIKWLKKVESFVEK